MKIFSIIVFILAAVSGIGGTMNAHKVISSGNFSVLPGDTIANILGGFLPSILLLLLGLFFKKKANKKNQ